MALALWFSGCAAERPVERPSEPPPPAPVLAAVPEEGAKVVSGDELTEEEILSVVFSPENLAPLQECLKQEIRRNRDLPREVVVDFSIGNDGLVSRVQMDEARLEGGELESCFDEHLRALTFRSYEGEVKSVVVPFTW